MKIKFGKAFGDMIIFEKKASQSTSQPPFSSPIPAYLFFLLLFTSFFFLIFRLFHLQILEGKKNSQLARQNRFRIKQILPNRGIIYDRNLTALVRNEPGFHLKKEKNGKIHYESITYQEALKLEAQNKLKTDDLKIETIRIYLYPEIFAHVLGFIGQPDKEQLKNLEKEKTCPGLKITADDKIGKLGIEKQYNCLLFGKKGSRVIEVDANEKKIKTITKTDPTDGQSLILSVSLPLQKKAYKLIEDKKAAVIASDPNSGKILALVSSPSFNPNIFTQGKQVEIEKTLADSKNMPLFNRAISASYPPGSTFKLVVAAAALEEKKINQNTEFEDIGVIKIGKWEFPNWLYLKRGDTDGFLNVVDAIKRSNDIFFYRTAARLELNGIRTWAKKFNLGKPLGVDIPGEAKGNLPSNEWKQETTGENWYLGDTYHLGIGQGYLLVTPLQLNSWTQVFASSGILYKPSLLKNTKPQIIKKDFMAKKTIKLVQEGMKRACAPGGTGWPLFDFKIDGKKIKTACKTGTAEYGDPDEKTHALFTVFAPYKNPQIVVTVIVEGAGEGSDIAAPIAKEILKEWFKKEN